MASLTVQLLTLSVISLQRQIYHNRGLNRTTWNSSYDFVVVGGGSAGCIVAARLSENPTVSVLLIEAGGPLSVTSDMIPTFYYLNYDWGYMTTPQRNAGFGLQNRQMLVPRGRILGGSNTINNAAYTRGNRHGYDSWSSYYGAAGWTFNEVLPYFLRTENNTDPSIVAANPSYHSTSGPVEITTPQNPDPIFYRFLDAAQKMGWPLNDINGPDQFGTRILQTTQSSLNYTRQSTAAAYIEVNIMARPNLHILLNTLVTRILFRNSNGIPTAYGVEFVRNNNSYQVTTNHEVIVSGGSINTPQLLLLSGVGPKWHLDQFNIPVVADLPVGENLYEHVLAIFDYLVKNESDIGWSRNIYSMLTAQNLYEFLVDYTGPLSRMPVAETYIPTNISGDRDWPDGLMYLLVNQIYPDINTVLDVFDNSNRDKWRKYFETLVGNNRHFMFAFSPFRPVSSGTVRLASTNPFEHPLIDPNYFGNRQDLISLVRAISIGLKIGESDYLRPYIEPHSVPVPGCEICPNSPLSECYTYLACVAQTYTFTTFHPCCTARMGNATNPLAVVDARLRLLNVQNLRVVDASVMPIIPNANINAATMMIGEKGSHMILQDNNLSHW